MWNHANVSKIIKVCFNGFGVVYVLVCMWFWFVFNLFLVWCFLVFFYQAVFLGNFKTTEKAFKVFSQVVGFGLFDLGWVVRILKKSYHFHPSCSPPSPS